MYTGYIPFIHMSMNRNESNFIESCFVIFVSKKPLIETM
jgi:hypothetical protein